MKRTNVTIWNEFRHEKEEEPIRAIYPDGMHRAIADEIAAPDLEIRLASLDEPAQGLPDELLNSTDVLFWWGHHFHSDVEDALVERIRLRVLGGMGLVVLHSGHLSKIFRSLMGTSCTLNYRVDGERERVWNIAPDHPVARGIGPHFELPQTEMYGERFDIPTDGEIIFMSWYEGGELFRSGVAFKRGFGRIFYFSPGHEAYPIYHDHNVAAILGNAARWAAPEFRGELKCRKVAPLENFR